ncbi:hypothetical protein GWK47_044799 [Chionoecetes opilio]|uniref:Uncharacterized protein n=1 Tax=Chionoecetes opilio TaxID=41210 RepID=A0A8J5CV44_CHIOP|nr:hypothetical protein GWK47_044799 [Chionoecetes opilio]
MAQWKLLGPAAPRPASEPLEALRAMVTEDCSLKGRFPASRFCSRGGKLGEGVAGPCHRADGCTSSCAGDTVQICGRTSNVAREVPLPRIATASTSSLEGPRGQVAAAAKDITGRLDYRGTLREAADARKNNRSKVVVDVAPNTGTTGGPRGRAL